MNIVQRKPYRILTGDVREMLRTLPNESVHCCVTSPPYWGLRDYGVEGQLGLEPTTELYVEHMVEVFREVPRVLRKDGTVWLNMGDCYAGSWGAQSRDGNESGTSAQQILAHPKGQTRTGSLSRTPGLKPKDLVGMPWRLAFALQADGWYLRSDIIWSKPNPMPESCRDRPTKAHEYVFLLTKSGNSTFWTHRAQAGMRNSPPPDYRWIDHDGTEVSTEPPDWRIATLANGKKRWKRINLWAAHDYFFDQEAVREPGAEPERQRADRVGGKNGASVRHSPGAVMGPSAGRNIRSVWTIPTQAFREAHFAVFPEALPERCIKAGTSEKGCCPECGASWLRVVERKQFGKAQSATKFDSTMQASPLAHSRQAYRAQGLEGPPPPITTGWKPSCSCPAADPVPCTVLDPFVGSGTTALVAIRLGRKTIGIDLSPEYTSMVKKQLAVAVLGGHKRPRKFKLKARKKLKRRKT